MASELNLGSVDFAESPVESPRSPGGKPREFEQYESFKQEGDFLEDRVGDHKTLSSSLKSRRRKVYGKIQKVMENANDGYFMGEDEVGPEEWLKSVEGSSSYKNNKELRSYLNTLKGFDDKISKHDLLAEKAFAERDAHLLEATSIPTHFQKSYEDWQDERTKAGKQRKPLDPDELHAFLNTFTPFYEEPKFNFRGRLENAEAVDPRFAGDYRKPKRNFTTGRVEDPAMDVMRGRMAKALAGDIQGFLSYRKQAEKNDKLRARGFEFGSGGTADLKHPFELSRNEREILDKEEAKNLGFKSYRGIPLDDAFDKDNVAHAGELESARMMRLVFASNLAYKKAFAQYMKDLANKVDLEEASAKLQIARRAREGAIQKAIGAGFAMEVLNRAEDRGLFGQAFNAIKQAWKQGQGLGDAALLFEQAGVTGGFGIDEMIGGKIDQEFAEQLVEVMEQAKEGGTTESLQDYYREIQENEPENLGEAFGQLINNPAAAAQLFVQSLSMYLPPVFSYGLKTVPAGAAAGLVAGGGAGAFKGAGYGLRSAFPIASFSLSYLGKIFEDMEEMGIDTNNPRILMQAWNSPAVMEKLRVKAAKYAGGVSMFDAVGALGAGRIGKILDGPTKFIGTSVLPNSQKMATFLKTGIKTGGEIGFGAGTGMLGDYVGQKWSNDPGEKVDLASVAAEGLLEVGPHVVTAPLEMARGIWGKQPKLNPDGTLDEEVETEDTVEISKSETAPDPRSTGNTRNLKWRGQEVPVFSYASETEFTEGLRQKAEENGISMNDSELKATEFLASGLFNPETGSHGTNLNIAWINKNDAKALFPKSNPLRSAYTPHVGEQNKDSVIFINIDGVKERQKRGDAGVFSTLLHESAHFAHDFIYGDEEISVFWDEVGQEDRQKMAAVYASSGRASSVNDFKDAFDNQEEAEQALAIYDDLINEKTGVKLRREWFAHQVTRVLKGEKLRNNSLQKLIQDFIEHLKKAVQFLMDGGQGSEVGSGIEDKELDAQLERFILERLRPGLDFEGQNIGNQRVGLAAAGQFRSAVTRDKEERGQLEHIVNQFINRQQGGKAVSDSATLKRIADTLGLKEKSELKEVVALIKKHRSALAKAETKEQVEAAEEAYKKGGTALLRVKDQAKKAHARAKTEAAKAAKSAEDKKKWAGDAAKEAKEWDFQGSSFIDYARSKGADTPEKAFRLLFKRLSGRFYYKEDANTVANPFIIQQWSGVALEKLQTEEGKNKKKGDTFGFEIPIDNLKLPKLTKDTFYQAKIGGGHGYIVFKVADAKSTDKKGVLEVEATVEQLFENKEIGTWLQKAAAKLKEPFKSAPKAKPKTEAASKDDADPDDDDPPPGGGGGRASGDSGSADGTTPDEKGSGSPPAPAPKKGAMPGDALGKKAAVKAASYSGEPPVREDEDIFKAREEELDYTAGQRVALRKAAEMVEGKTGELVTAGYAGTGKTTIMENIIRYALDKGRDVVVLAPTYKALSNINKSIGKELQDRISSETVQQATQRWDDRQKKTIFGLNGEIVSPNSLVLVDEASMLSNFNYEHLQRHSSVLYFGDGFQLPPVGGDNRVMQNPDVTLTEVKRQSLKSNLFLFLTALRSLATPKLIKPHIDIQKPGDLDFKPADGDFKKELQAVFKKWFQGGKREEDSVVAICHTNKNRSILNQGVRKALGFKPNTLNEGEQLLVLNNGIRYTNSETLNVTSASVIDSIDKEALALRYKSRYATGDDAGKELSPENYDFYEVTSDVEGSAVTTTHLVIYDTAKVGQASFELGGVYTENWDALPSNMVKTPERENAPKELADNLYVSTYGYALTAHKAQGSQWNTVFVYPDVRISEKDSSGKWRAKEEEQARWLYTAMGRARKRVVLTNTTEPYAPFRNAAIPSKAQIEALASPPEAAPEAEPETKPEAEPETKPEAAPTEPENEVDPLELEKRDGLQYFEGKPFTGVAVSKLNSGAKLSEATYKNGNLHGPQTFWYSNGQKSSETNFKDGKRDGITTRWYDNGKKEYEYNYKDDDLLFIKEWDEKGTLTENKRFDKPEAEPEAAPKRVSAAGNPIDTYGQTVVRYEGNHEGVTEIDWGTGASLDYIRFKKADGSSVRYDLQKGRYYYESGKPGAHPPNPAQDKLRIGLVAKIGANAVASLEVISTYESHNIHDDGSAKDMEVIMDKVATDLGFKRVEVNGEPVGKAAPKPEAESEDAQIKKLLSDKNFQTFVGMGKAMPEGVSTAEAGVRQIAQKLGVDPDLAVRTYHWAAVKDELGTASEAKPKEETISEQDVLDSLMSETPEKKEDHDPIIYALPPDPTSEDKLRFAGNLMSLAGKDGKEKLSTLVNALTVAGNLGYEYVLKDSTLWTSNGVLTVVPPEELGTNPLEFFDSSPNFRKTDNKPEDRKRNSIKNLLKAIINIDALRELPIQHDFLSYDNYQGSLKKELQQLQQAAKNTNEVLSILRDAKAYRLTHDQAVPDEAYLRQLRKRIEKIDPSAVALLKDSSLGLPPSVVTRAKEIAEEKKTSLSETSPERRSLIFKQAVNQALRERADARRQAGGGRSLAFHSGGAEGTDSWFFRLGRLFGIEQVHWGFAYNKKSGKWLEEDKSERGGLKPEEHELIDWQWDGYGYGNKWLLEQAVQAYNAALDMQKKWSPFARHDSQLRILTNDQGQPMRRMPNGNLVALRPPGDGRPGDRLVVERTLDKKLPSRVEKLKLRNYYQIQNTNSFGPLEGKRTSLWANDGGQKPWLHLVNEVIAVVGRNNEGGFSSGVREIPEGSKDNDWKVHIDEFNVKARDFDASLPADYDLSIWQHKKTLQEEEKKAFNKSLRDFSRRVRQVNYIDGGSGFAVQMAVMEWFRTQWRRDLSQPQKEENQADETSFHVYNQSDNQWYTLNKKPYPYTRGGAALTGVELEWVPIDTENAKLTLSLEEGARSAMIGTRDLTLSGRRAMEKLLADSFPDFAEDFEYLQGFDEEYGGILYKNLYTPQGAIANLQEEMKMLHQLPFLEGGKSLTHYDKFLRLPGDAVLEGDFFLPGGLFESTLVNSININGKKITYGQKFSLSQLAESKGGISMIERIEKNLKKRLDKLVELGQEVKFATEHEKLYDLYNQIQDFKQFYVFEMTDTAGNRMGPLASLSKEEIETLAIAIDMSGKRGWSSSQRQKDQLISSSRDPNLVDAVIYNLLKAAYDTKLIDGEQGLTRLFKEWSDEVQRNPEGELAEILKLSTRAPMLLSEEALAELSPKGEGTGGTWEKTPENEIYQTQGVEGIRQLRVQGVKATHSINPLVDPPGNLFSETDELPLGKIPPTDEELKAKGATPSSVTRKIKKERGEKDGFKEESFLGGFQRKEGEVVESYEAYADRRDAERRERDKVYPEQKQRKSVKVAKGKQEVTPEYSVPEDTTVLPEDSMIRKMLDREFPLELVQHYIDIGLIPDSDLKELAKYTAEAKKDPNLAKDWNQKDFQRLGLENARKILIRQMLHYFSGGGRPKKLSSSTTGLASFEEHLSEALEELLAFRETSSPARAEAIALEEKLKDWRTSIIAARSFFSDLLNAEDIPEGRKPHPVLDTPIFFKRSPDPNKSNASILEFLPDGYEILEKELQERTELIEKIRKSLRAVENDIRTQKDPKHNIGVLHALRRKLHRTDNVLSSLEEKTTKISPRILLNQILNFGVTRAFGEHKTDTVALDPATENMEQLDVGDPFHDNLFALVRSLSEPLPKPEGRKRTAREQEEIDTWVRKNKERLRKKWKDGILKFEDAAARLTSSSGANIRKEVFGHLLTQWLGAPDIARNKNYQKVMEALFENAAEDSSGTAKVDPMKLEKEEALRLLISLAYGEVDIDGNPVQHFDLDMNISPDHSRSSGTVSPEGDIIERKTLKEEGSDSDYFNPEADHDSPIFKTFSTDPVRKKAEARREKALASDMKFTRAIVDQFPHVSHWCAGVMQGLHDRGQLSSLKGHQVDDLNFIQKIRLYFGKTGDQLKEIQQQYENPVLELLSNAKLKDPLGTFGDYLYARYAPVRNRNMRELRRKSGLPVDENTDYSGLKPEDRRKILKNLDKLSEEQKTLIKKAVKLFDSMNKRSLDLLAANGVLGKDALGRINKHARNDKNEWVWAPLRGVDDAEVNTEDGNVFGGFLKNLLELDGGRILEEPSGTGTGAGFSENSRDFVLAAAKGRYSQAESRKIFAYALKSAAESVIRSNKNEVSNSVGAALRVAFSQGGDKYSKVAQVIDPTLAEDKEKFLRKREVAVFKNVNGRQQKVIEVVTENLLDKTELVLTYRQEGKPIHILFEDSHLGRMLVRQLKNADNVSLGPTAAKFKNLMSFFAKVYTVFSPNFMVSNMNRDLLMAYFTLKSSEDTKKFARTVLSPVNIAQNIAAMYKESRRESKGSQVPKELKARLLAAKAANLKGLSLAEFADDLEIAPLLYQQAGGRVAFFGIEDAEQRAANLARRVNKMGKTGKIPSKASLKDFIAFIQNLNTGVENGVRLQVFREAIRNGMSLEKAAGLSRDVTVDFNRKGNYTNIVNTLYLFFNASVQGNYKLLRAFFTERTAKQAGALVGQFIAAAAVYSFISRLWAGEDEETEENHVDRLSEYERNHQIQLWLEPGTGKHLKVHIPYGLNTLLSLGRRIGDVMWNTIHGKGGATPVEASIGWLSNALDVFNPLGAAGHPLISATPHLARPLVNMAGPQVNFMGNPIYPDNSFSEKTEAHQHFSSVNPLSREAAQWWNRQLGGDQYHPAFGGSTFTFSPETLDELVNFIGGGSGRMIWQNLGSTLRPQEREFKTLLKDLPVLPVLYRHGTEDYNLDRRYFKLLKGIDARYKQYNLYKSQDPKQAIAYAKEIKPYLQLKGFSDNIGKQRKYWQRKIDKMTKMKASPEKMQRIEKQAEKDQRKSKGRLLAKARQLGISP